MSKLKFVLLAITAVLLFVSCGGGSNPLADTQWQVTDYADPNNTTGMSTVLLGTTLTAVFSANGEISGSASCNSYSGTYEVEGESLTISSPLAVTMMMCVEPGSMEQETVFLNNLQSAAGYKLENEDSQLQILNDKGQVTLLLKQP